METYRCTLTQNSLHAILGKDLQDMEGRFDACKQSKKLNTATYRFFTISNENHLNKYYCFIVVIYCVIKNTILIRQCETYTIDSGNKSTVM